MTDEEEIRRFAYDQASAPSRNSTPDFIDIERQAVRIARFIRTGSFEEVKTDEPAAKVW